MTQEEERAKRREQKRRRRARRSAERKLDRTSEGRWRVAAGVMPRQNAVRLTSLRGMQVHVMCARCADVFIGAPLEARQFIVSHRHAMYPGDFRTSYFCWCGWCAEDIRSLHEAETDAASHRLAIHPHGAPIDSSQADSVKEKK